LIIYESCSIVINPYPDKWWIALQNRLTLD